MPAEPQVATDPRPDRSPSSVRWFEPALLPGRWSQIGVAVIGTLLVAHVAVQLLIRTVGADGASAELASRFDLDLEGGVPAWFSAVLLFLCAQALWRLADRSASGKRRRWVRHERFLAVVFVYLSLDEMAALHEIAAAPLQAIFGTSGFLSFAWVLVALPLVAVLAALYLGWLRSLPRPAAGLILASGMLYVGGAAGVEMVGAALYAGSEANLDTFHYSMVVLLEEALEMLGALLFMSVITWMAAWRSRPR
ncbi:MAG: hypothetical protein JWQ53_1355 [Klenkia sp.]|nr:hypothetical protein [Klenkia sp.]